MSNYLHINVHIAFMVWALLSALYQPADLKYTVQTCIPWPKLHELPCLFEVFKPSLEFSQKMNKKEDKLASRSAGFAGSKNVTECNNFIILCLCQHKMKNPPYKA